MEHDMRRWTEEDLDILWRMRNKPVALQAHILGRTPACCAPQEDSDWHSQQPTQAGHGQKTK